MVRETNRPAIVILVPAAGRSARMQGADKLLLPVAGEALLRRQTRAALASGAPVAVTLPRGRAAPRAAVLAGLSGPLRVVHIDGDEGLAASVRMGAALAAQRGALGLMVLLPDMPGIETGDMSTLARIFVAAPDRCLRAASAAGQPGHPVILPARLFPALAALRGDTGARGLLAAEDTRLQPLSGQRAIIDLDTPEAWAAWQARTETDAP